MISIIGLGKVGSTIAEHLTLKKLDDLVLFDIVEGLPQGTALDLNHMASQLNIDLNIRGTNEFQDLSGADIVLVSAGFPRTPDISRLDLLNKNKEIINQISKKVKKYAPESKVIVVTNPLDLMTYLTVKVTNFERYRVFGVGSELDAARLKFHLSSFCKVSYSSIDSIVIGEHGDSMVASTSLSKINGIPIEKILTSNVIKDIIDKLKKSGSEVISLKGSTTFGIAGAVSSIVESLVHDKKSRYLISVYLNGEYNYENVCIGVPAIIGKNGVEKIIEIELTEDERIKLSKSVEILKTSLPLLF